MHKEAEFLQKLLPGYYMVGIAQLLGPAFVVAAFFSQLLLRARHPPQFLEACPPCATDNINSHKSQSQKHKSCQLLASSVGKFGGVEGVEGGDCELVDSFWLENVFPDV